MSIFIPPKGSQEALSGIALHEGELVYNTTKKKFYTGDGTTLGGMPVFEDKEIDLSEFATKSDIASLLSGELDPIFSAASGVLANKDYVDQSIASISGEFALSTDVPTKLSQLDNDADYAKITDIPVVTGYAMKEEIPSITAFITKSEANSKYALKEDIPDVDKFITINDTDAKYAVKSDITALNLAVDEKADASDLTGYVQTETLNDYVTVAAAANFATGANLRIETETARAAEANGLTVSQSNYQILMGVISHLQDQIIALKQTNVETYAAVNAISDSTKDAVISVSSTVTTAEVPTSIANITAKSIQVKDLDVDSVRLNFTAEDDIKITNFESTGALARSISNASNSINTNGYITIKDCTLGQGGYNAIEIGLNSGIRPEGVTIDNVHFTGTFSNNVILIFDAADDAIVNISNCIFDNCDNPLRISNRSNGKLTVNIVNCEFTVWGNGGNPAYNGMIICEDYTSASAEAANENNLFAPEKVKINIINCTHNGEKIAFSDPTTVCGTKNANQLIYVYYDKVGFINYDAVRYPQLTAC